VKPQALAVFTIKSTMPWYCFKDTFSPVIDSASKSYTVVMSIFQKVRHSICHVNAGVRPLANPMEKTIDFDFHGFWSIGWLTPS
jgi:hypothetical protein